MEPAGDITDSNYFAAGFVKKCGGKRAHIAKSLDHSRRFRKIHFKLRSCFTNSEIYTAACGSFPAERATQIDGLSGDYTRAITVILTVFVHKPRHDLSIGVDVRGGDVFIHTNDWTDPSKEPSRQLFQFPFGIVSWIYGYAAFSTTVRDIHYGSLVSHESGQGPHFVQIDFLMVTDPTLKRTPGVVVLNAIPLEDGQRAVVPIEWYFDGKFTIGHHE